MQGPELPRFSRATPPPPARRPAMPEASARNPGRSRAEAAVVQFFQASRMAAIAPLNPGGPSWRAP